MRFRNFVSSIIELQETDDDVSERFASKLQSLAMSSQK